MAQRAGIDGGLDGRAADAGCTYIVAAPGDEAAGPAYCGAPRQPHSPYCAQHHALCHLSRGSRAEARGLRTVEALAEAVGGRQGRPAGPPAAAWLRRVEHAATPLSRPDRSRYVREGPAGATAQQPAADAAPTPERRRHGPIERPDRPIADAAGRPARPYRAVDTLQLMERRGSITAGMRQAGEDFRARFAVAQLDPLRALDLSRLRLGDRGPRPDRDGPGLRIEAARGAVWRALVAVGGIASPAGSCLWHVLGWERTLKEWALEQGWSGRLVSQESASGILIAALGALESHFRGTETLRNTHSSLDKSGSI